MSSFRHKKAFRKCQRMEAQMRKTRKRFSHDIALKLIRKEFPGVKLLGHGAYKKAFRVCGTKHPFVLKAGRDCRKTFKAYKRIPKGTRNRKAIKIYWATRWFMAQRLADTNGVKPRTPKGLALKHELGRYGLGDVRPANMGFDTRNGRLKALDFGFAKVIK